MLQIAGRNSIRHFLPRMCTQFLLLSDNRGSKRQDGLPNCNEKDNSKAFLIFYIIGGN